MIGLILAVLGGVAAGTALGIAILSRRFRREEQQAADNYQHRGYGLYW